MTLYIEKLSMGYYLDACREGRLPMLSMKFMADNVALIRQVSNLLIKSKIQVIIG